MSKHEPRTAREVDVYVGSRIRTIRQVRKMSQERLGDILGVTFQQVQKYEKGSNRVGASRLYDMAKYLDCPIQDFFPKDIDAGEPILSEDDSVMMEFIGSSNGISFAKAILAAPKAIRPELLELVRKMANFETSATV